MRATAAVTLHEPSGGWSAVLQVPSTQSEEALALALVEQDGVLVHPGYFFDFPREAFVVVSLLPEPAVFDAGVARLHRPRGGAGVTAPIPRQSGIGVPLFSLVSSQSWGIGEFADLPAFGGWCTAAGQRYVQLLPLNETSPGETSPYSSMSAMALDPIYIRLGDVADFAALGGETALDADDRRLLAGLRAAPQIRYGEVRTLKTRWLRRAYLRFVDDELARATPRAEAFRAYEARQSWWLDAYTTFRAIHAAHEERAWWDWPPALAFADPEAVREAAAALGEERRYRAYLQWIAEEQWQAARSAASVRVFGDLPSWCRATAPTCGPASRSSCSTPPLASRPTRSATPGRTGACRRGAGRRCSPPASSGCAPARAGRRRSSTACASITWSGSIASTSVPPTRRCRRRSRRPTSGRRASSARRCSASTWPAASRWWPRISAPCPTSSAGRSPGWACQGSRCCAGSASGASRRSRSSIPRPIPTSQWRCRAPTTPRR